MREKIIVSNLNGSELLRSLALKGVRSFGVSVLSPIKLAKEALLRNGIVLKEKEVSSIDKQCIIYKLFDNVAYFNGNTFDDAKNASDAIDTARSLCRNDECNKLSGILSQGEFVKKNEALLALYKEYNSYLKEKGLIDSLGIINRAISKCSMMNADIIVLKETPLTPLEEELVKKLSANNYQTTGIANYAGLLDHKLENVSYTRAYGATNEVEHIISTIVDNGIPYDNCVIALTDPSYISHFMVYANNYGIPVTYGNGLSLSLSNPAKVLDLLRKWNAGFNGVEVLKNLLNSEEFDTEKFWNNINPELNAYKRNKAIEAAGGLRLSISSDNNQKVLDYKDAGGEYPEEIEKISQELMKGYSYLISTYSIIRTDANMIIDTAGKQTICSYIETIDDVSDDVLSLCDSLFNTRICKELSKAGAVHLTSIAGALATYRKHLFICGLGARVFPGSPRENYLLLDSDLNLFGESEKAITSDKKVLNNKKQLFDLIEDASAFGSQIHISYSNYDLTELKAENPSSCVFEIFKLEHGNDVTIKDMEKAFTEVNGYFESNLSSLKAIGKGYMDGKIVEALPTTNYLEKVSYEDLVLSPSSAEKFFGCPRRFFLTTVMGVKEPDEFDVFRELPANEEGTLIHECMEDLAKNSGWDENAFMDNAEKHFDNYFKKHIPVHDKNMTSLKAEFLKMAKTGFDMCKAKKTSGKPEMKIDGIVHEGTGLKFKGTIDRIEENDGIYQIVDFKTGRKVKHEENDVDSCFQVLIYAWMLNKYKGWNVTSGEYRYLRRQATVDCSYDDNMKSAMDRKLQEIKDAFDKGDFGYPSEEKRKEACRYCKLIGICGVKNLTNENVSGEEE